MGMSCMEPASLDSSRNQKIQDLENDLGADIVALEPGCAWAHLNQDQLQELKDAEKQLGVVLLAYTRR